MNSLLCVYTLMVNNPTSMYTDIQVNIYIYKFDVNKIDFP